MCFLKYKLVSLGKTTLLSKRENANSCLCAAYGVLVPREDRNALLKPRLWSISLEAEQKTWQQQAHS